MMKPEDKPMTSTITGVEMFRKLLDREKPVTTQVCYLEVLKKMTSKEVW